ncbi:glutathione S-transferase [Thetidibacter halocola]|uniref:Glutathione S-transferase n=1 Tax=Thetidibacter halocola TaxID=2827239 RepID=A0A8J7WC21_9RHOB|nr:glutathione S-transferase [Thetidibacter halocola]MBS0124762.1 glutathione S-transferase [Thetidibacter halocola]
MSYTLFIGDRTYSSWSLRGWMLFARFGIGCETRLVDFDTGAVADQLPGMEPARTVPCARTPEGAVIWDSLAMAEELASRHPEAGLWPSDPAARATARSLAAEMHSGFSALRRDCPMNLRVAHSGFQPSEAVLADLARIESVWAFARERFAASGPWLFGAYTAADVFFAPVAARIATYDLAVSEDAQAYVAAHIADPEFRRWRAMGFASGAVLARYAKDLSTRPWPGPAPRLARAVAQGTPENDACPYSGKPVTHLMAMEGRIFGFCNAFCRDKTVADPKAWPRFMALV